MIKKITLTKKHIFRLSMMLFMFFAANNLVFAQDTDNDGVANATDLDDDNDGILDANEGLCIVSGTESFESPVYTNLFNNTGSPTTSNGWAMWPSNPNPTRLNYIRVNNPTNYVEGPNNAQAGNQYMDFHNATTYLYRTFTLTTSTVVNASAWLANRDAEASRYPASGWSSRIQITSNSNSPTIIAQGNIVSFTKAEGNEAWKQTSLTNVALPAGTYRIRIFMHDFGHMDNINYCFSRDTDGDSTPDYLDLDSDGDTCPDALEGDENVTASQLTANRISGTVNANGVPNLVNSGGAADIGGDQGQGAGQAYTVNPAAVGGTASSNQTIVSGATPAALSLSGHTGTIQWQSSTDNVTFNNISGATSTTYAPGALTATTYYRAVLTSAGGCTANSTTVTINIDSDGDGVIDSNDVDDDNDGILDRDEAGCAFTGINLEVSSVDITNIAQTKSTVNSINYGEGNGKRLTDMTFIDGSKMTRIAQPTTTFAVRRNSSLTFEGFRAYETIYAESLASGGNNILVSHPTNMEELFEQGYLNAGMDNTFFNTTSQSASNIERLDILWKNGVKIIDAKNTYILVNERGGQENARISVITGISSSDEPTGFLQARTTPSDRRKKTISSMPFTILRKPTATSEYEIAGSGLQDMVVSMLSFAELGVNNGDTIYGFSLLPNDAVVDGSGKPYLDWTNPTYYPTNTTDGADLGIIYGLFEPYCSYTKDTDGDGTPDHLDLDSDNDGCADAIEGGDHVTQAMLNASNAIGTNISGTLNIPAIATVDANGVPVLVNSGGLADIGGDVGQGIGDSQNIMVNSCAVPFICNSNMYMVQDPQAKLYRIDTSTNPFNFVQIGTGATYSVNATGYNPTDNFIYGINGGATVAKSLIRIDANGTFYNLGVISGLDIAAGYTSGEIDNNGNYYIKLAGTGNNKLYKVDIATRTATLIPLSRNINFIDIAYSVTDQLLWTQDTVSRQVVSINPVTGAVNNTSYVHPINDYGAWFGSGDGKIYASSNSGSVFTMFDKVTGAPTTISASQASTNNDGAHCPTAPIKFDLYCSKLPVTNAGTRLPSNHGITALGRAGADNSNWPMVRQSAWTVLEAKTKGFVVNRVANPTTDIANPVEGMMVFDTTAQCLKIYNGTVWSCYSTPACP